MRRMQGKRGSAARSIVAVVAVLTIMVGALGGPAAAAFPTTHEGLRNWAPTFMTWPLKMSLSLAVSTAKKHDVIAATKATFRPHVDEMKAANPDLEMLVYLNGALAQKDEGTLYPEEWYARDANGNKARTTDFGNYVMNVTHPGWIEEVASNCAEFLAYSHYDGCLLDNLGLAVLHAAYVTGKPINPATGQVFTDPEWIRATSNIVRNTKARVGSAHVIPNGVGWGRYYWNATASTKALIMAGDGGMVELFMRPPKLGISSFRNETDWKKDVDMLVDAEASGKSLFITTKAWVTASLAQKDAVHRFALASFLLGTNGSSYFTFLYDRDTLKTHPWWESINIGDPVGPYKKVGGLYEREFTRGKVIVNPTKSSLSTALGGSYTAIGGATPLTSVVLPANSAQILTTTAR